MEPGRVKELLELMREYRVAELDWQEGESRISLRMESARVPQAPAFVPAPAPSAHAPMAPMAEPAQAAPQQGNIIKSPMVGTFYRAAKPGAPPFVEVGHKVSPGKVLCIIEAMKLMNELECEVSGTIAEILVENGKPVQFGQPLFRIA